MDYLVFFVVVMTILVAFIALLTVHHVYKVREMKLMSNLRKNENAAEWHSCEKMLDKSMKKFPKLMKQFMKGIEESL